jgi:hypothetical protein
MGFWFMLFKIEIAAKVLPAGGPEDGGRGHFEQSGGEHAFDPINFTFFVHYFRPPAQNGFAGKALSFLSLCFQNFCAVLPHFS